MEAPSASLNFPFFILKKYLICVLIILQFVLSSDCGLIYGIIINIYAAKELLVPKGLTLRRIEPFD